MLLIVVHFTLNSCGGNTPAFTGVDFNEWKTDRNGCLNKRKKMAEAIALQKDKLLTLEEREVVNLLGRPDENELYERNQKFYYYFLTPSGNCEVSDSSVSKLEIRFSAIGLVKEISVKKDYR